MLRYTEFDRQKVRALLDEHANELAREERLIGNPSAAIARNREEIERLREIMSDSERVAFDELLDSELADDERKARENLIIARHENREIQADSEARQDQAAREGENGVKIAAYLVLSAIGVMTLLFLFR